MHVPVANPVVPREPLTFTRPNGPLRSGALALADARRMSRHDFVFNRQPHAEDLQHITPARVDAWDRENYVQRSGLWFSKHSRKVVLADIDKVDAHAVKAMLAAGLRFSMRVPRANASTTIHLEGNHTWSLWGWAEAVARGDVQSTHNTLVHVDDHPDLSQSLRMQNMPQFSALQLFIEQHVKNPSDVLGVESFIWPAALSNMLGAMLWVYGEAPTQEAEFYASFMQSVDPELYKAMDPYLTIPSVIDDIFTWGVSAYRSDYVPAQSFKWFTSFSQRYILDVDIDVCDEVDDLARIVNPYLNAYAFPGCITLAVSPHFGAYENHIEKVMAMLGLIRARAAKLSS